MVLSLFNLGLNKVITELAGRLLEQKRPVQSSRLLSVPFPGADRKSSVQFTGFRLAAARKTEAVFGKHSITKVKTVRNPRDPAHRD